MKDVMLDLETFSLSSNAVIVQIGACYFDRFTGEIGEKFFEKIDPQSCVDAGFEMDVPTILWWMQQDETARQGIMDGDSFFVSPVLIDLKHFLRDIETIWSHATFDFVILTNYFHKFGIRTSFDYHAARDLRTLCDLADIDPKDFKRDDLTKHDALSDCIFQVGYATACFNRLRREDI